MVKHMKTENLIIIGVVIVLLAVIGAGIGGCAIDANRDRAYMEHGYTQKVLPGGGGPTWVKEDGK